MANKDLKMKIWREGDRETPEVKFLKEKYGFKIDPNSENLRFSVIVNGNTKFYPAGTVIHFHNIDTTAGKIKSLQFKFQKPMRIIWKRKMGVNTPEMRYMAEQYNFLINGDEFSFTFGGNKYSYPIDSKIEFYNINKDANGKVLSLCFQIWLKGSKTWQEKDGLSLEIVYLMEHYDLHMNKIDGKTECMLNFNDKQRTYENVEKIKFGNIIVGEDGEIKSLSFNFE